METHVSDSLLVPSVRPALFEVRRGTAAASFGRKTTLQSGPWGSHVHSVSQETSIIK
ncbi:hypothetical protein PGTUg99_021787 [Puccinia graminis f. sp. tritici]|uniref:Uncharacterized protein n=1 Tax=Puccinia graminis f. sp. tritici TaxID=56615 RepID=A0A5B0NWZ5_PUCGR|nr:hypothetical protein PGTUg99_021787 [Puccinia graminis f. sp. tritici]